MVNLPLVFRNCCSPELELILMELVTSKFYLLLKLQPSGQILALYTHVVGFGILAEEYQRLPFHQGLQKINEKSFGLIFFLFFFFFLFFLK